MVAVHTLCATNVAVGVLHFNFPFLAALIYATADRASGLLDGYVECANLHVSFLVVTCLFLLVGRCSVHLCLGCLYLFADGRSMLLPTTESRDNLSQRLLETDNRVDEIQSTVLAQQYIVALYIGYRHKFITERVVIFREQSTCGKCFRNLFLCRLSVCWDVFL